MTHVAVIGAGVIGLCTALELARRDVQVTVVDADVPGSGASSGNAGWVVPSLAGPVPAPGVVPAALRWMLRPDSPLTVRPHLRPTYARWLAGFWRASSARRHRAGLEATARLGARTFALFDQLAADGIAFEMHRDGVLFAYRNVTDMERDRQGFRALAPYGYGVPEPLLGADVQAAEPALGSRARAAYLVSEERSIRPESLVAGLAGGLERHGVRMMATTPCRGLVARGNRVAAACFPHGELEADAFVIACGVGASRVLRSVGLHLPIEAGKGYALDYARAPRNLRRPVYLHDERLAITPFDGGVRVAGKMELGGGPGVSGTQVESMARTMSRTFEGWPEGLDETTAWSGMRPMTPDGLPVIGMMPGFANLCVASGHAMLGVTLAPATAEEVADLITSGQPSDVLRPFDPSRFRDASRGQSGRRRRQ